MTPRKYAWPQVSLFVSATLVVLALQGCGSAADQDGTVQSADGTGANASAASAKAQISDSVELAAEAQSSAMVKLSWTPPPEDVVNLTYRLLRDGNPLATLSGETDFEDLSVQPSTRYTYSVQVLGSGGSVVTQSSDVPVTTPARDSTAPMVSTLSTEDEAVPVNSAIAVEFSAPMASSTLNAKSFVVEDQAGTQVPGEVSVKGNAATFKPSATLAADSEHTATITTSATDAAGNAMASAVTTTFATAAVADTTRPTVVSTLPAASATAVPINASIYAMFSEHILASSATTATFRLTLASGTAPIAGTIRATGGTVAFTPSAPLAKNTAYRATLTTGLKDLASLALAANFTWTFTTGSVPDTTPPRVIQTYPAYTVAQAAPVNTILLTTFSEPLRFSTVSTSSYRLAIASTGVAVPGTILNYARDATVAAFIPAAKLLPGTRYAVTVTTAIQDAAGNPMAAATTWYLTTASAGDTTPPRVTTTSPASGAGGVSPGAAISATFSEAMRNTTLTTTSFTLVRSNDRAAVAGVVSVSGNTATFRPTAALAGATQYTATITTAAKDAGGNSLGANYVWTFTTAPATTTATLQWDAVNASNLSGYRIYYGTSPGTYLQAKGSGLNVGKVTTYTVSGLQSSRRYYFAATSMDSTGRESVYSNEVFKDIP